ncbi:MAG: pre-peptidase C-terminal domain-containing protein, partial [Lentisphaeria bacterium]|nr:pre-peptidase C-terminal domain-containing protein [Lentisphaeria bacterium]
FDYTEGSDTIIAGTNSAGELFSVSNNEIKNVRAEKVSVSGNILISDSHFSGDLSTSGNVTITGDILLNGMFNFHSGTTITAASLTASSGEHKYSIWGEGVLVENSSLTFNGGAYVEMVSGIEVNNSFIYGNTLIYLHGGEYSNVTVDATPYFRVRGTITLNDTFYIEDNTCSDWLAYGSIDANGQTIVVDYTERSVLDDALLMVNKIRNAEIVININSDQVLGTYAMATNASQIGQGDEKGVWDVDTNTWKYQGAVYGDLDGVIELRDENGVFIANCTVNGDTEYSGRYNYTVNVDANGNMNLTIGINSREGLAFAADGYNNNSFAKATKLTGNVGSLDKLTIDSASDVDYYKFTLDTAGRAASSIGIDYKMWKGDLDLYLYDSKGNLVDYAKSVTDNEVLSLHKLAAGDYYLKVVGYEGNTNEYTLNWNLPQVSTLNDATESGNDKAHSYHLGKLRESVSVNAAISDANDEDYFMFILEKGMTSADSISITYDRTEAELDFYIYGSNGKDLIGRGVESYENGMTVNTINFAGFKHGVYYVRVVSADGGAVDYTLNANIGSNDVNPDKWENNNSLKKASNLYALNGTETIENLSIHSVDDVDYFKFKILEDGSVDDYIAINHNAKLGDLDIEILDLDGNVVAYSRTAEDTDTVSLNGLKAGEYYAKVAGYNNTVNNYTLDYHFTNSALIASDVYEGIEDLNGAIDIRQSQTISDLSIASVKREDETRADTFKITLEYHGWKSSKIILTDYRSDWEGLNYVISTDAAGKNVVAEGIGSEISLAGYKAGEYYLTVDTPVENQYSNYSVIAQHIPDSNAEIENTWSIFVYLAGDNNLEGAYLTELLYMQQAILPENVEVYVLMDRSEGYSTAQRDWTDTRVGKIRHSNGGAVAVEWMYFEGVDTDTYMNTSNLDQMKEWDTGSISTLEAFLDWGMQTGRADNYALIMKDHGTSLGWNSSDETSNSMLSITEISDLLKQDKYDDLSVVAFDQCLMGSDVVITEMEKAVEYTVASEAVGYTPNQLMMYKVLFNSLETDMTPEELAEKMVASCNCSGKLDLTLAAFDTENTYLSTALNNFAANAAEFNYADWTAICTSFGTAFNYGDEICAFSDLLSILKETLNFTVSSVLEGALNKLISDVSEYVIKAAQITPAAYGNGLAVFNPVLSSDQMNQYYYVGGGTLDYYASSIGQMAWGDFLYTVGKLAGDVSAYMTENIGKLTFNDFDYYFGEENKEIIINLGAFSGDGITLEGLYVAETARFNLELLQAGIEGDAIRIAADNPDANITITLIQTKPTLMGEERTVRRTSNDGILSLAGVDFAKAGVYSDYELVISTDKATSYTMSFEANWASGVDRFDFARTNSIDSAKGGNNVIDKATQLAAGNYAGLLTYTGDADYYQLNTVYADELDVIISGEGLSVKEFDADGKEIKTAVFENGKYIITVSNGNYLYVEGNANISKNKVNSYFMQISDTASTYLDYAVVPLPSISVEADTQTIVKELLVTVTISDGAESYYSTDLINWIKFENTVTLTQNGVYYFKASKNELDSNYTTLEVSNIDSAAPTLEITGNATEWTNKDVVLTAVVSDGVVEYFANGKWTTGNRLTVSENGTYQFRVTDEAGNVTEKSVVVDKIDKVSPTLEVTGNAETLTNKDVVLTATASDGKIEYFNGKNWVTGSILTATENGTYQFRVTDLAGNVTEKSVIVDKIDKVASTLDVTGNATEWTNKDVILTAVVSDGVVEYFNGKNWIAGSTLTATENGTYQFRVTDEAGNVTEKEIVVDKIDKVAPTLEITGNATAWTNKDVVLTATASDGKIEYFNGKNWVTGSTLTVSENGTYQFRVTDEAGNVTEKEIVVDKIDKVSPTLEVTGNATEWTNKDVILTANVSDGVVEYFDGENWVAGSTLTATENGTYQFRVTDEAGNVTEKEIVVDKIDKVAPTLEITGNATAWTNQDVILTANVSDGVVEYFDGENWVAGSTLTATENGTYQFRVTDEAGNVTEKSVTVDKIDKVAPVISNITANITELTNSDVIVYADFNDANLSKMQFKIGNGLWQNYDNGVTMTENGTVYFKAEDAAGNIIEEAYTINNIIKIGPVLNISVSTSEFTNQKITITLDCTSEFTDITCIQYRLADSEWLDYTGAFDIDENQTIYFRAYDSVGNIAQKSINITNIDKVAPTLEITGNATEWT